MIEFKITNCPDKSQQATYQHLGKELTFGKSEGDMIVDDPAFGPQQLRIVILGDKAATIENLHAGTEVRLNGKAILGAMPLKEKDNVTVARTTINFMRIDLGPLPAPDPYDNPNHKERFSPGSKEKVMLQVLEHLEKGVAAAAKPPLPPGAAGPKPPIPPGAAGAKPPIPPGKAAAPPPLPKKS